MSLWVPRLGTWYLEVLWVPGTWSHSGYQVPGTWSHSGYPNSGTQSDSRYQVPGTQSDSRYQVPRVPPGTRYPDAVPRVTPYTTLVPNTKVASLDTYIILKETSRATDSDFSISRAAKAMDLNISPLIQNFKIYVQVLM